ncbi:hypothetical protein RN001_012926 [Aquatica leii]|uniref:Uncharacterized protein n=1 Tax=Aquatica leii TaxID=1421715 RepID=A0AAN7P1H9_9COLE|nr:hypothetical protein RN001_012926 [Aquatica leii]
MRTFYGLQFATELTRGTTEIKAKTSLLTPSQALALYLVLDLAENKYKVLRSVSDQECHVSYELLFTMMDGSVSIVLSDTNAASKSMICGAIPKDMNTKKVLTRVPHAENYSFGLSTLHCWIRLPIKSWQVKGNKNMEFINMNKKRIQADFKSKMSLLVDKPKSGCGSTNDITKTSKNDRGVYFSNSSLCDNDNTEIIQNGKL